MSIIDQCRSHYGPLSRNNRALLATLLDHPDEEVWNLAKRIIISPLPLINLEMAIKRISKHDCEQCPDPFTVFKAIQNALNKHYDFLREPVAFDSES